MAYLPNVVVVNSRPAISVPSVYDFLTGAALQISKLNILNTQYQGC